MKTTGTQAGTETAGRMAMQAGTETTGKMAAQAEAGTGGKPERGGIFGGICLAFSLYSRLPVPGGRWQKKNRRYVLCAFPAVGCVIGFGGALFGLLCLWLGQRGVWPRPLLAAAFALFPLWLTGGIHLDGFLDTLDALASCAEPSRKLEILKDPHVGAFAVIGLGGYLLLWQGAMAGLLAQAQHNRAQLLALPAAMTLSRACSAGLLVSLPDARADGMKAALSRDAAAGRVRLVALLWAAASLAAVCAANWRRGAALGALAGALALWYAHKSRKTFGGVTGDLAGWYVTVQELGYLAVLTLGGGA